MEAGRRAFLLGRAIPRPAVVAIGEDCLARQGVTCRSCLDRCDAGAIAFILQPGGVAQPRIIPERCTGCGDCVADCPTLAIALAAPISEQGKRA